MKLLFLGLSIAYNPFYMLRLMQKGGLGGMSLRLAMSGMFLLSLVYFFSIVYLMRNRRCFHVDKSPLLVPMSTLLLLYVIALLLGLINQHDSTWFILDSFPLLEMFIAYYFIKFASFSMENKDVAKIIKWLCVYLTLMCIFNIAVYVYLTFIQELSFGSIRANVEGVTVNRLMDFIIPLFMPVFINYYEYANKKGGVIISIFLSLVVTVLTFWRTLFLASMAGILLLLIQKKKKFLFSLSKIAMLLIAGIIVISVVQNTFNLSVKGFNVTSLAVTRFTTIFTSLSGSEGAHGDGSGSLRIENNKDMLLQISSVFAFGYGMGGAYEDDQGESVPIQVTSNYFLQIMLLMGVPAALLFVWIFGKTLLLSLFFGRTANTDLKRFLFSSCSSILVSLAVILMLFPYTNYFPLLYIFGLICGITDKIASQKVSKTKELSRVA